VFDYILFIFLNTHNFTFEVDDVTLQEYRYLAQTHRNIRHIRYGVELKLSVLSVNGSMTIIKFI